MPARPSEPLLAILRATIKKRGISTAELAGTTQMDRSELKKCLAGQADLTVDQFLLLAEALGLADEAASMAGHSPQPAAAPRRATPLRAVDDQVDGAGEDGVGDDATGEEPAPIPIKLHSIRPAASTEAEVLPPPGGLDPEGSPSRQLVESGFLLGLDMFLHFERRQLDDSGVPPTVLNDRRFVELLPIRLEARWHRHNRPEFLDEHFRCKLSFDALYTCTFPWRALRQVGFTIPPDVEPEPPKVEPPPPARPVLRLVKD